MRSHTRSTRTGAVAALVLAATLAAGGLSASAGAGTSEPPNVLVIMTDDMRADDFSVMRRTQRAVGERGTTFQTALASFPLCCPSRATYLSGQYAHNHGVRDNVAPEGGVSAFDDSKTLATALDDAGYRTGWIGKYMNGYPALGTQDPPYVPPGWDDWKAATVPGRLYGWKQLIRGEIREWPKADRFYQTDVYSRQGAAFIRRSVAKPEPFFLTIGTLAPHGEMRSVTAPRNPRPARRHRRAFSQADFKRPLGFNEADMSDKPPEIAALPRLDQAARTRIAGRWSDRLASLLAVDEMVRNLILALRETGELDNTYVIFTSDNGFFLGEHRLWGKSQLYSGALRVPLLIRGPGMPAGREIRVPVTNVDLAATIYDLTGVTPALPPDGISLQPVATTPAPYADRTVLLETLTTVGVQNRDARLIERGPGGSDGFELYDLHADPGELRSVYDDPDYAVIRLTLTQKLRQLRDCAGATCN